MEGSGGEKEGGGGRSKRVWGREGGIGGGEEESEGQLSKEEGGGGERPEVRGKKEGQLGSREVDLKVARKSWDILLSASARVVVKTGSEGGRLGVAFPRLPRGCGTASPARSIKVPNPVAMVEASMSLQRVRKFAVA